MADFGPGAAYLGERLGLAVAVRSRRIELVDTSHLARLELSGDFGASLHYNLSVLTVLGAVFILSLRSVLHRL